MRSGDMYIGDPSHSHTHKHIVSGEIQMLYTAHLLWEEHLCSRNMEDNETPLDSHTNTQIHTKIHTCGIYIMFIHKHTHV